MDKDEINVAQRKEKRTESCHHSQYRDNRIHDKNTNGDNTSGENTKGEKHNQLILIIIF